MGLPAVIVPCWECGDPVTGRAQDGRPEKL